MSRRGVDFILELEGITEDDLTEPICTEMQEYFNRLDFPIKQVGVLENNNLCIQGQDSLLNGWKEWDRFLCRRENQTGLLPLPLP